MRPFRDEQGGGKRISNKKSHPSPNPRYPLQMCHLSQMAQPQGLGLQPRLPRLWLNTVLVNSVIKVNHLVTKICPVTDSVSLISKSFNCRGFNFQSGYVKRIKDHVDKM